jgi:hypothetical protein
VRAQQGASTPDRFEALRFLAGTWRGDQAGQPGRRTAEHTYQFILNDRFLQETNTSTYAPQEKNKNGEVHHHMSMISYDTARKLFVFRQFHAEGFVNTYVQQPSADDKTIVFVSKAIENILAAYRARETYTILSRDEFTERFDIAEPGKDFELYPEARLNRVRERRVKASRAESTPRFGRLSHSDARDCLRRQQAPTLHVATQTGRRSGATEVHPHLAQGGLPPPAGVGPDNSSFKATPSRAETSPEWRWHSLTCSGSDW